MYLLPEQDEMESFEDRYYLGWEDPGNDALDRTPSKWEREVIRMEAENYSSFDEDGMVR